MAGWRKTSGLRVGQARGMTWIDLAGEKKNGRQDRLAGQHRGLNCIYTIEVYIFRCIVKQHKEKKALHSTFFNSIVHLPSNLILGTDRKDSVRYPLLL